MSLQRALAGSVQELEVQIKNVTYLVLDNAMNPNFNKMKDLKFYVANHGPSTEHFFPVGVDCMKVSGRR